MSSSRDVEELVAALKSMGFEEESQIITKAATANAEDQARQKRYFAEALHDSGYGSLPQISFEGADVVSFPVEDIDIMRFPRFLERFVRAINRIGNKDYELYRVERGVKTLVKIKMN